MKSLGGSCQTVTRATAAMLGYAMSMRRKIPAITSSCSTTSGQVQGESPVTPEKPERQDNRERSIAGLRALDAGKRIKDVVGAESDRSRYPDCTGDNSHRLEGP